MKNLIIGLFVFVSAYAAHQHADIPSTHGMAVVGAKKVYLSHLPMFHSPHDYQVILEVELDLASQKTYVDSLVQFKETVYTVAPETGILPEMAQAGKTFRVDLFRGHFERGGTLIAEGATVKVVKVLYFKKFLPNESKSNDDDYLLFGNSKEQFAAHLIVAKPDFDRLLSVKTDATTAQALERGPQIRSLTDLKILRELYFETGDLAN